MRPALSKDFHLVLIATLIAGLGLALQPVQPAYAATINVTPGSDTFAEVDLNGDGMCTLREAVISANTNPVGGYHECTGGQPAPTVDVINVPAGTYNLTATLTITDDVTINGAGAVTTIIDGGGAVRVFAINLFQGATISGVTIQNGSAGSSGGGGIYLDPFGTLVLNSSTVSGNTASYGGGIYNNSGTLTLGSSTVSGNTSTTSEAFRGGGGIFNQGTLYVNNSTVSGNSATSRGGGILTWGSAVLNNSTVSGNTAATGGGIFNQGRGSQLLNSTVSGNTATTGDGGGINNYQESLTIDNSTVSGNTATTGSGGGIYNRSALTLLNSTISDNTAATGGGIYILTSPLLRNTIVAAQALGTDCAGGPNPTSSGYNLDSDGSCHFGAVGDRTNPAPGLGPLANNGGPTQTHALLPGSPAIDAGDPGNCPAADQRGTSRPQDGDANGTPVCDSGAYEALAVPTIVKAFVPDIIKVNGVSRLTFTIVNPNVTLPLTGVAFTDNLPGGVVIATPPNMVNTCGGTVTAVAGTGLIQLTGGGLAAGGTCQVSVDVTSATVGVYVNTSGPVTSNDTAAGGTATDTLTVVNVLTIAKAFAPDTIRVNDVSTLTFTIVNPNALIPLTGVAFTDNLPAGVVVATLPNVANSCNGTVTADAGTGLIQLANGNLAAGGTCTLSVDVTGAAAGVHVNTSGTITSNETGPNGTATDTLTVAARGGGGADAVSTGTVGSDGLTVGDGCVKIVVEAGDYPVGSIVAFDSNPSPDNAKVFGDFRLDEVLFFRVWVKGPDGAPMSEFAPPLLVCAQPCRGGEGTTLFDWDEVALMWRAWPTFVQDGWHCTNWYGNLVPPPPGDQTASGDGAVTGAQTSVEAGQTVVVEAPAVGPQVASAPSIGLPETGAPPGPSALARTVFGVVIGLGMICGGMVLGRHAS